MRPTTTKTPAAPTHPTPGFRWEVSPTALPNGDHLCIDVPGARIVMSPDMTVAQLAEVIPRAQKRIAQMGLMTN